MTVRATHVYEFGPFRLDAIERVLLREGQPVPLTPKAFATLLMLVQHSGHIVEKDDLMQAVWPDTFVEEVSLARNVSVLRKTLGESDSGQPYIETIPKRGYRFAASVREWQGEPAAQTAIRPIAGEEQEGRAASAAASSDTGLYTAPQTRRAARRPVIALAVAVTALVFPAYYLLSEFPQPSSAVTSIAVLPFKPLLADNRNELLELGMTDTLINRLSNIGQVVVRPTSAVRKYLKNETDPITAGRELGVEFVLDGSIQRSADRIRATVRLVSARDGATRWAGQFDEKFTDIFAVQDSISEQVAEALAVTLTGQERELLTKHHTDSAEAYHLYLTGRYYLSQFTEEGAKKALEFFNKAIAADPNYALAYAGLAEVYTRVAGAYVAPVEAMPKARQAAQRALELDERLAEAHRAMALVHWCAEWNWPEAERELRRALELNPSYTTAYVDYARFLARQERFEEAIAQVRRAQEIDPHSVYLTSEMGRTLHNARRYDQAIAEYRKALELDPQFAPARRGLGRALWQKGMQKEAIAEMEKAMELNRDFAPELGYLYAAAGRRGEALKILKALEELAGKKYVPPVFIAKIYAGLGEKEPAFAYLQKGYEDHSDHITILRIEAEFDGLRSDSRFTDLLRRVGLAQG
ncbi:MAG TPA: tetratricopeptide repeat protein [Blastocatellia bacterium]|nr:tetratricopeptide repeat protein [Blastocatellia bacterium]